MRNYAQLTGMIFTVSENRSHGLQRWKEKHLKLILR